jgi:hypothetical protein
MAERRRLDWNDLPATKLYKLKVGRTIDDPWQLTINDVAPNVTGWTLSLTVWGPDGTVVIDARTVVADDPTHGGFVVRLNAADSVTWAGAYTYTVLSVVPVADPVFTLGATKDLLSGTIEVTAAGGS